MQIRVTTPRELSSDDRQLWESIHKADPSLASPYFHPEFTLAVDEVSPNTRVAVLEEGEAIVGFLPFERGRFGVGKPVGRPLSDFQGAILLPQTALNPCQIVRAARLSRWDFDHLLASQREFAPFVDRVVESPRIDLSGGFEAYTRRRREAGSARLVQLQRKSRKLEREVGEVGFVAHRVDPRVLEFVFRMKSRQCRRTGSFDFLGELSWTAPLLQRIAETDVPGFSGMLSVLYAGGRIAAAHLGMRSETVLHWWLPVHDPDSDLAPYSPGALLLMMLAEHAAGVGLQVMDLGKGDDPYKASFKTGAVEVAEGSVETPSLQAALRHAGVRSREWLRRTPVLAPLRRGVRAARGALLPRTAQQAG